MVGVNRNRDNLTLLLLYYFGELGIVKFCGLIGISLSKLFKRIVSQKKFVSKKIFFVSWIWGSVNGSGGESLYRGAGLQAGLGARGLGWAGKVWESLGAGNASWEENI